MTDFLTTLPWGWYALACIIIYGLIRVADYYNEVTLPRARENLDVTGPPCMLEDPAPVVSESPFTELDHEWLALHQIGVRR